MHSFESAVIFKFPEGSKIVGDIVATKNLALHSLLKILSLQLQLKWERRSSLWSLVNCKKFKMAQRDGKSIISEVGRFSLPPSLFAFP